MKVGIQTCISLYVVEAKYIGRRKHRSASSSTEMEVTPKDEQHNGVFRLSL